MEGELYDIYGDQWRERLPKEDTDVLLEYVRLNRPGDEELGLREFVKLAELAFDDGCYVHAIKYYSTVIELDPENWTAYAKRAASYVKVYEVRATEKTNVRRISRFESLAEKSHCRL